jgi:predicted Zn finger-like uncharacterized protein
MNMVTRCPSCATSFRVYSEQLSVRAGHVRCGQCSTIFDARAALIAQTPEPSEPPIEEVPPTRTESARAPPVVSLPVVPSFPVQPEISLAEAEPEFNFGREARRRSRILSALASGGIVVLSLLFAAQVVHAFRGDLAVAAPTMRPWLEAACRVVRCSIPLPRDASYISIESSELASERGVSGMFTLSGVLRNRAGFAQAYPGIELTLTNTSDRAIARRVLMPADYLDEQAARGAVFAANSEYNLKMYIDTAELAPTGYRLYLFYDRE